MKKGSSQSEEAKRKISIANTKPESEKRNKKWFGVPCNDEEFERYDGKERKHGKGKCQLIRDALDNFKITGEKNEK